MTVTAWDSDRIRVKTGHWVARYFNRSCRTFDTNEVVVFQAEFTTFQWVDSNPCIPSNRRKTIACFLQNRTIRAGTITKFVVKVSNELQAFLRSNGLEYSADVSKVGCVLAFSELR